MILATVEFTCDRIPLSAHLMEDDGVWTVPESPVLEAWLNKFFRVLGCGTVDGDSIHCNAHRVAEMLEGKVTFLEKPQSPSTS